MCGLIGANVLKDKRNVNDQLFRRTAVLNMSMIEG